eukprot:SAG22_NODE_134_length_18372_cov_33.054944_10_plen_760_part_00
MHGSSDQGLLLVNKQPTPLTFSISGVTGGMASCLDGSGLPASPGFAPPIDRLIAADGSITLGPFGVAVATVTVEPSADGESSAHGDMATSVFSGNHRFGLSVAELKTLKTDDRQRPLSPPSMHPCPLRPDGRLPDPPSSSPGPDALWRPRFHYVGYNQTNRGHIQDPSGVIYNDETKTWHVFPDCWPCQGGGSLTWCHISGNLTHWTRHKMPGRKPALTSGVEWNVGTGAVERTANGSWVALFGGCAISDDGMETWRTLRTPGPCYCGGSFKTEADYMQCMAPGGPGGAVGCAGSCATNLPSPFAGGAVALGSSNHPDGPRINCSAALDTSRPFRTTNGSVWTVVQCDNPANVTLNNVSIGAKTSAALFESTNPEMLSGWAFRGVLFAPIHGDYVPGSTERDLGEMECPEFFPAPTGAGREAGQDDKRWWVFGGSEGGRPEASANPQNLPPGGPWACRLNASLAGTDACPIAPTQGAVQCRDQGRYGCLGGGSAYWTGHLDEQSMRFHDVTKGTYDYGNFYAAKSGAGLSNTGRRVLFGWVNEVVCAIGNIYCPNISMSNTSFDGVLSFPREVSIEPESGVLRFGLVPEFLVLRRAHEHHEMLHVADGAVATLSMTGQMLDFSVTFQPSTAGEFGVSVLASEDFRQEVVRVGYNATRRSAFIDVRESSQGSVGMPWVYNAPLILTPGRGLALRCLVDKSVLECFADETAPGGGSPASYRRVITARSYYSQPTSARIGLFSAGAASVAQVVDVWAVSATD